MKHFFMLMLLQWTLWAFDGLHISHAEIHNGETVLMEFYKQDGITPLSVKLEDKKYLFFTLPFKQDYFYALLPVAYNSSLGKKQLTLEYIEDNHLQKISLGVINVIKGNYKEEQLRVNRSKVKLSQKSKRHLKNDYKISKKIYAGLSTTFMALNALKEPMDTPITSRFGNERLFNGVRKSYHSGIDYRAKVGTAVSALGWGRVALVQNRFYGGLTVAVDHGHGIFSAYAHLSKTKVKVGDIVSTDKVIALSGVSGRITGPHLHFSTKLHGVTVNPLQLVSLLTQVAH